MESSIMMVDGNKRILVVDDDPGVRSLLVLALQQRSLIVDEAADGAEALTLLRENRYAVILLDLLMPIADGFSVLEGMTAIESQSIPVVLVLTGADRNVIRQLDSRFIHGVVRKPFDVEELTELVVACAEIKGRNSLGAMAIATIVGGQILALLNRGLM